jgi:hypothetical protein
MNRKGRLHNLSSRHPNRAKYQAALFLPEVGLGDDVMVEAAESLAQRLDGGQRWLRGRRSRSRGEGRLVSF